MKFRHIEFTVSELLEKGEQDRILFNPEYQRRSGVWPSTAKSKLIETILMGLPVPPLMISIKFDEAKEAEVWEIIDGQQRYSSLENFRENSVRYQVPVNGKSGRGILYRELDPQQKRRFSTHRLSAVVVEEASPEQIRETFVRINLKSTTLNPTELRHGRYDSPNKKMIAQISDTYSERLVDQDIITKSEKLRMKEVGMISEILASIKLKKAAIYRDDLDRFFESKNELVMKDKSEISRVKNSIEFVLDLNRDISPKRPLRNHNFVSLVLAAYANKWGGLDIGSKYKPLSDFTNNNDRSARNIIKLLDAKADREYDMEAKYGSFVQATRKTTDSKYHREIRAQWFLRALNSTI